MRVAAPHEPRGLPPRNAFRGVYPRGSSEIASVLRFPVLLFIAALVLAPVAHGCHGGDEDHEPVVVPRVETEPPRPSS
jgi:hypothetical protein